MKKVNSILIIGLFLASIVIISIFGLKVDIYHENIPVTKVECNNQTDSNSEVSMLGDKKFIKIKFEEGEPAVLYLNCRALPDNASNKRLRYDYDRTKYGSVITERTDENGNPLGVFEFNRRCILDMTITATDGTEKSVTVKIKIY